MQKSGFQYPLTKANSQLQLLIKPDIAEVRPFYFPLEA